MKLDVKAFGLTAGLIWGVGIFIMTWWIIAFDGATGETIFMGRLYRGYDISPSGSLIGLIWGLMDGLVGGLLFAWVYNLFSQRVNK